MSHFIGSSSIKVNRASENVSLSKTNTLSFVSILLFIFFLLLLLLKIFLRIERIIRHSWGTPGEGSEREIETKVKTSQARAVCGLLEQSTSGVYCVFMCLIEKSERKRRKGRERER